jgi:hypothetical protein
VESSIQGLQKVHATIASIPTFVDSDACAFVLELGETIRRAKVKKKTKWNEMVVWRDKKKKRVEV